MARERRQIAETVREAIQQSRPFASLGQEAVIAIALTSEVMRRPFQELFAKSGDITPQQYNVLRILRGAGSEGLCTLAIVDRMVEHTPGITRLLDRLENKGLVARERSSEDRRQVVCRITKDGQKLLAKLDKPVQELDARMVACLSKTEARTLISLLNRVRNAVPAS